MNEPRIEPTITCPNCQGDIPLTESLAAPLIDATRKRYEERLLEVESRTRLREESLNEREKALEKSREEFEDQFAAKLKSAREEIAATEAKKARELLSTELSEKDKEAADLKEILASREEKLAEAQKAQAELLKKERELADEKRELELTVEKRVQASLQTERAKGKKDAEEEMKLKVAEKEHTIAAMQKQIDDLKRRAEQGSQQLQGEVQELELEGLIRLRFPMDEVEPVPKGQHGGDAVHRVMASPQHRAGTILWESKRTKNWSDGWLSKLREDQRAAKADIAILMTQAMPKEVDTFELVDGVWVTSPRYAMPLCLALRSTLLEVAKAKRSQEGQDSKMELVYQYLIGPQFRHRVTAIVEKFSEMQADLEKERRTMTKSWAKREEQIRLVVDSTARMYGDLQAIAGSSLHEIEGLGPLLLEDQQTEMEE